jgi:sugar/nucleoside kinase (ribokinase family)
MRFDACVIGHVTQDIIQVDGKIEREMPGGTAYYTSMALRSLGCRVAVITKVSEQDQKSLLQELERAGIAVFCRTSQYTTVFENIYFRENPEVRVQKVRSIAAPFSAEDLAGMSASIFHVGPLTNQDVSPEFLKELPPRANLISLDVQGLSRNVTDGAVTPRTWQGKEKGLAYVDILKADEEEAKTLAGQMEVESAGFMLSALGPKEVIITMAGRGALIFANGEVHRIPAFRAKKIVDPTGCGDTFMAGYIHERLRSQDIPKAGRFASLLAASKMERFGALVPDL